MAQENNIQERLLKTIKSIIENPKNERFTNELRKALEVSSASSFSGNSSIEKEVRLIREALNIQGNQSIDYSFVKSDIIRKQLIVDNLRMENAALDLDVKKFSERFYNFCLNAFYQIEGLVNYYYSISGGEHIAKHIQESINKSEFASELASFEKENGLNAITIAHKLTALGVDLNFGHNLGASLYYLKELRNESLHRGTKEKTSLSQEEKEKQGKKDYFWSNQSFDSIRSIVSSVASKIQNDLSLVKYYSASVKTVLPSAVFITIAEKGNFELPYKFLNSNSNCKQIGSQIKVGITCRNGEMEIVEVGEI